MVPWEIVCDPINTDGMSDAVCRGGEAAISRSHGAFQFVNVILGCLSWGCKLWVSVGGVLRENLGYVAAFT